MKIHIKKDDLVEIISGADSQDKDNNTGRVVSIDRENYRAIVEGKNMITKHTKPSAANPQGGISKMEAPIHISNLLVVDPKSGKGRRVGFKKNDAGKSVRIFKKSGEEV